MDPWALQSGSDSEASIHSPHLGPPQPCCPPISPVESQRSDSKQATACVLDPTSVSLPEDVGTCCPQAQAGLPRPLCGAPCYFFMVWPHPFLLSRDHPELLSTLEPVTSSSFGTSCSHAILDQICVLCADACCVFHKDSNFIHIVPGCVIGPGEGWDTVLSDHISG